MNAVATQVKTAQPMGAYKPTNIDGQKQAVEFRLVAIGKKATVVWSDGKVEHVTDKKLSALQSAHSWATDF